MEEAIKYGAFSTVDSSLRYYQLDAKKKIFSIWDEVDDILYQMPTGTGKTRLFTSLIRDILLDGLRNGTNPRILIIAHRTELIQQISENLTAYKLQHGVFAGTMKSKRDPKQRIQVASIQTITHPANREKVKSQQFNFIIIDEAHHALAETYKLLWKDYPSAKKLGVSATPWRLNGEGFTKIFEAFIPSMSIKQFIQEGWLAKYHYYSIKPDSQTQRRVNAIHDFDIDGDYSTAAMEQEFDRDHIRAKLLSSYEKFAKGKKGIIYSITRQHSENICTQYQSAGINIVSLDCLTPAEERKEIVNNFKKGLIDIIVNVDIFSEGFDCPDIEFIQLARPTKSLVKYLQQVGRGLRKNGDKECIILDNVGLYNRFGLPNKDRDWTKYFEGHDEVDNQMLRLRGLKDVVEEDVEPKEIEEGEEEMILIQDSDDSSESTIPDNGCIINISKSFCRGEYRLVENSDGLFVENIRSRRMQQLLYNYPIKPGEVTIEGDDGQKIKKVKRVNEDEEQQLGYLIAEGLKLRFRPTGKGVKYKSIEI